MEQLDRITQQPGVMGGKDCIRNMRVTVGMIVGQLAAGRDMNALLADYPYLEQEDIAQALRYAAGGRVDTPVPPPEAVALLTVDAKRARLRLLPL